jgi:site-specific DNA-methyltransferase (adenine-specific)
MLCVSLATTAVMLYWVNMQHMTVKTAPREEELMTSSATPKVRAPRNRTLTLSNDEEARLKRRLVTLRKATSSEAIMNRTICQDAMIAMNLLPASFADLIIIDPPYNRSKKYNKTAFVQTSDADYEEWVASWMGLLPRLLRADGSVYICCDWQSSTIIHKVASRYFQIQNRITWEREKGRGAKANWKNSHEDIWFCTASDNYHFNVEAVKLKRRVIAPYRDQSGQPKDWDDGADGAFRMTHPSNIWTDITVPFWSMPENTDHPTQKPEKLIAKLVLASSRPGAVVFDPFAGAGTTSVVSKKLGRAHVSIELDEHYCCLAEKRLAMADRDKSIQGYSDGVFWERNTLQEQQRQNKDCEMEIESIKKDCKLDRLEIKKS